MVVVVVVVIIVIMAVMVIFVMVVWTNWGIMGSNDPHNINQLQWCFRAHCYNFWTMGATHTQSAQNFTKKMRIPLKRKDEAAATLVCMVCLKKSGEAEKPEQKARIDYYWSQELNSQVLAYNGKGKCKGKR